MSPEAMKNANFIIGIIRKQIENKTIDNAVLLQKWASIYSISEILCTCLVAMSEIKMHNKFKYLSSKKARLFRAAEVGKMIEGGRIKSLIAWRKWVGRNFPIFSKL